MKYNKNFTSEQRAEYNRKRKEAYRAAHPIVTEKQRNIIEARARSLASRAKEAALKDIKEEQRRVIQQRACDLKNWNTEYRERSKTERLDKYEERMTLVTYRRQVLELHAKLNELKERYFKGEYNLVSEINQIRLKIYNKRKYIALNGTADDKRQFFNDYNDRMGDYERDV